MLQKLLKRFLEHRHYWRVIAFDELAELYTMATFRTLAQSIIGIFIPIYLYQLGYEVPIILAFYGAVYFFWQMSSLGVAWLVARIGPKHTMLYSQLLMVISLAMLVSLVSLSWPLLLIALFYGASNGAFFVAFHVDFSKVKHREHGGKEVGWLFAMQRVGIALGPIVGGTVGLLFGAQYIFLVAILLLGLGTLPLFTSAEPTKIHQKISFTDLRLHDIKRDLFSYSMVGIENIISMIIWPFFISMYIFTEDPYIKLGIVTSASVLIAFFAAKSLGAIIDDKKGRQLLRIGVVLNAGLHMLRPFVKTFPVALLTNMVNEIVTPMYRMPFYKGMFDAADDLPGRRIVYLSVMESISTFARSVFFFVCAFVTLHVHIKHAFFAFFAVGALCSLLIASERFRALNLSYHA